MTLKSLIISITRQNPVTKENNKYLCLSVWEKQGLKLYPHQVEAFLKKCSPPASILRAAQRAHNEEEKKDVRS